MKNFKKRKYISRDANFFQNPKAFKNLKVDKLSYETQSSINWHEVKIILDATVVEKYLNNKKSPVTINNGEKNLLPDIHQAKERISNLFSQRNNVMVKVEFPEDIDNLAPEESLIFADGSVKQEDYTSAQEAETWYNDTFDNGLYTESIRDDKSLTSLAIQAVSAALKSESFEPDSFHEEVTVGQEFKHEELIPRYENTESTGVSAEKSSRSTRKKKKCLDCDDCSHGVVKKPRISSHLNNKPPTKVPVKSSNICTSKSISEGGVKKSRTPSRLNSKHSSKTLVKEPKICSRKPKPLKQQIKTPSETSTPEPLVKPHQPKKNTQPLYCAHCNYVASKKRYMPNHLRRRHVYLFPNDPVPCAGCEKSFGSKKELERHRAVCSFYLVCKFCLITVSSRRAMVYHVKTMHPEGVPRGNSKKVVTACLDSTKEMTKAFEQTEFGQKFTKVRKYYIGMLTEMIKLYCSNCSEIYDRIPRKKISYCGTCNNRLVYQCQKCGMTRTRYPSIWQHLIRKGSNCNIAENPDEKPFDSANQGTSSDERERERYDCEICDFKGTTRAQLHGHVLIDHLDDGAFTNCFSTCSKCGARFSVGNLRLKRHEEFCGMSIRFPCRFCPMTCVSSRNLTDHVSTCHLDELGERDMEELVRETMTFKKMVKGVNNARLSEKLRLGSEAIDQPGYYHTGIQSMLKPICLRCKASVPQLLESCAECHAKLEFLCLQCDEIFSKYSTAWEHATRTCENRSFTLTLRKAQKGPVGFPTDRKRRYHCDQCTYKNPSKSVLSSHIRRTHQDAESTEEHFACSICALIFRNSNDLNYHRIRCRVRFVYTCEFCSRSSTKFKLIRKHTKKEHADIVRRKGVMDTIMQQVKSNRRAVDRTAKSRDPGKKVKRRFSENVKLTRFECLKCNETVQRKVLRMGHTKSCAKCSSQLRMQCKVCNRVYFKWSSIASHLQTTECGATKYNDEPCALEPIEFDHSYAIKTPPTSNSTT